MNMKRIAISATVAALVIVVPVILLRRAARGRKGKNLLDIFDGTVRSRSELDKRIFEAIPNTTTGTTSLASMPLPTLPAVTYPPTPRFDFSSEEGRQQGLAYLQEHGYVVARDVLTPQEVLIAKSLFWDWMEAIPSKYPELNLHQALRGRPDTWGDEGWPADRRTGILSCKGIGHCDAAWFIRSRAKVIEAFQAVWGDKNLLTSFDGCGVFRPWRGLAKEWRTMGGWWHVDQNPIKRPGKACVQGLVSLYANNRSTGGLTVIPSSHKSHIDLARRGLGRGGGDFIILPPEEPVLQQTPRLVACEPGDLTLWDSRTVHCNCPGEDDPSSTSISNADFADAASSGGAANTELLRLVFYVCMTPAKLANRQTILKRIAALGEKRTTTHWPHEFMPVSRGPEGENSPYVLPELVHGANWK